MGDDGVGIRVVNELRKKKSLAKRVDVIDGATLSFQLINFFDGYKKIVIVDAVDFGKKPGRIFKLRLNDVLSRKKINVLSSHEFDVFFLLKILENIRDLPEIVLIGIQIQKLSESLELSPSIASAIPKIVKKILKEITPSVGRRAMMRRKPFLRARLFPT